METLNTHLHYQNNQEDKNIQLELIQKVHTYFKENKISIYGNMNAAIKAILIVCGIAVSYTMLIRSESTLELIIFYISFGWLSLILAFNFAHDASHDALFKSKKLNALVFELLFNFQGSNAYLWKIRHIHSHHLFPNIEGADADLDGNELIKLYPEKKHKAIYRYQHIYGPVLYMFYSLVWIFYKDFSFLFKKKHANLVFDRHPTFEIMKLCVYKIIYLSLFLFIPMLMTPISPMVILLGFIVMHMSISLYLIFTFLISHYCMEVEFSEKSYEGAINNSWLIHQANVCVDFHAESKRANMIFGGFNAHLAHHLFPKVCHIHYPAITSIIRKTFEEKKIPYRSVSFIGGIISHLQLLKKLGNA